MALYVTARAMECTYRSLKGRGLWKYPGASWQHNDALLFALSSAQVMYAWVMRPDTIPDSSRSFIQRTGPIDALVVDAVRRSNRGQAVDMQRLNQYAASHGVSPPPLTSPWPRAIPASLLTRGRSSARATRDAFLGAFRRTLPLYFSLSVVPYTVFNPRRALSQPLSTLWHASSSALRSTTFLSTFVAVYMAAVCTHRTLFTWDHKLVYWLAGCVAGSAVLLEKKSRRSELALYVLPRAADSWLQILTKRRWLPDTVLIETALFGVSMAALFLFREREPDTVAPLIKSILTRVVFGGEAASDSATSASLFQLKLTRDSVLGCALVAGASSGRLSQRSLSAEVSPTTADVALPCDPLAAARTPRSAGEIPDTGHDVAEIGRAASAATMECHPRNDPPPSGRWSEADLASLRARLERARRSALRYDASQRAAWRSAWQVPDREAAPAAWVGQALSPSTPRSTCIGFDVAAATAPPSHGQPETCSQGPWLPAMGGDDGMGSTCSNARRDRTASSHCLDESFDALSVPSPAPTPGTLAAESSSFPPISPSAGSSGGSPAASPERRLQGPAGGERRRPPGRAQSLGNISRALARAPRASAAGPVDARPPVLTRFGSAPTHPVSLLVSGTELDAAWELQCMLTVAEVRQRTPLLEGGHPTAAAAERAPAGFHIAADDVAPAAVPRTQGGGCLREVISQLEAEATQTEVSEVLEDIASMELSGRLSPQVEAVYLAHRVLEAPARPR